MDFKNQYTLSSQYLHKFVYLVLTTAMFFLGVNVVTGKFLVSSFPIFLLLDIRFFIGVLTFFFVIYFQNKNRSDLSRTKYKLKMKEWGVLFLQALFGGLLFNILMLYGLRFSTATSAGILTSTTPVFTVLFSFLFLSEKINKKKILAVLVACCGVVVINVNVAHMAFHGGILGNFLILLAVLAGSIYIILIKLLAEKISATNMAFMFNLFSFILFLPFATWNIAHFHFAEHGLLLYALVLIYSVSGSVLFPILWNKGICMTSASTASLFTAVLPISTAFLAVIFLHEGLSMMQVIGMLLVLFSIALDAYSYKKIF